MTGVQATVLLIGHFIPAHPEPVQSHPASWLFIKFCLPIVGHGAHDEGARADAHEGEAVLLNLFVPAGGAETTQQDLGGISHYCRELGQDSKHTAHPVESQKVLNPIKLLARYEGVP